MNSQFASSNRLTSFRFLSLVALLPMVGACGSASHQPQTDFRATATIKDIMDSTVEPSADALWDSVSSTISVRGVENKEPRTPEEWADVRRHAIRLLEATNSLLIPGRNIAKPGERAENPKVELAPEQIQTLVAQDRQAWVGFAHSLYDAVLPALQAIDAKNVDRLLDAGEKIDSACENCHLKYWYPNSDQAVAAAAKKP